MALSTCSLSSMTTTTGRVLVWVSGMMSPPRTIDVGVCVAISHGQAHPERGSVSFLGRKVHRAAIKLCELARHPQAEARAPVALGGDERLKEPRLQARGDARPGVRDPHHHLLRIQGGAHLDAALRVLCFAQGI